MLKNVNKCCEKFDELLNKGYSQIPLKQKEKINENLDMEIRKLRKLREKIINIIKRDDKVKDKSELEQAKSRIEEV